MLAFILRRVLQAIVVMVVVALIAFLAMQVGVHPRALRTLILLSGFVCPRPIALRIPP